jgi:hypothetical protein
MDDTPFRAPQQFDWRLCRALALVAVGAAMHLPLPGHAVGPVPTIAPMNFVHLNPRRAQPRLTVERRTVFAPAMDEGRSVAPAPRVVPAPIGLTGRERSASLLDAGPPELDGPSWDAIAVPVPTSGAVGRGELSSSAGAAPPARQTDDRAPAELPDGSETALPTTYASVSPAVLRTMAGSESTEPDKPEPEPLGAGPSAATEEQLVRRLLDDYAGAYERLDVEAAQAIYPNVNEKALKRAFDQLAAQRVTLQKCGITISGSTANARCRASATFQPRIGSRSVQIASREWTFDLSKKDTAWQIVNTFVQ